MLTWMFENTVFALALAALAAVSCRLLKTRPAVCHLIWMLVLVRLVVPPLALTNWPPDALRSVRETVLTWTGHTAEPDVLKREYNADFADSIRREKAHWASKSLQERGSSEPSDMMYAKSEAQSDIRAKVEPRTTIGPAGEDPDAAGDGHASNTPPASDHESSDTASITPVPAAGPPTSSGGLPEFDRLISSWPIILLLAWAVGAVLVIGRQVKAIVAFHRALRHAAPADEQLLRDVGAIATLIGTRVPETRVMNDLATPIIWCWGRPMLVWPSEADHTLRERRSIITHELAHVRRGDHWIAWIELAVMAVHWWNPLYWYVRRQIREYADLACDAWVVSLLPTKRRMYAESLLDVVQRMSSPIRIAPALSVAEGPRRRFERRLAMIVGERPSCRIHPVMAGAVLAIATLMVPSWAAVELDDPTKMKIDASAVDPALEPVVRAAQAKMAAGLYFDSGDWKRAADAYRTIAMYEPENGKAFHRLSFSLIALGDYDGATQAIERQLELNYEPATAYYNLACTHSLMGELDAAAEHLDNAIKAGFSDLDLLKKDTDLDALRDTKAIEKAMKSVKWVKETTKDAQYAAEKGDWTTVAELNGALGNAMPLHGEPQHWVGYALIVSGQPEASIRAFERQYELGYRPATALYNLACAHALTGEKQAAMQYLQKATKAGFNDMELLANDSDLDAIRDYDEFAKIAKHLKMRSKVKEEIHAAMESEDWATVIDHCEDWVEHTSDKDGRGWAYENAGTALFYGQDYDAAADAFVHQAKDGYELNRALYNVACCHAKSGAVEAGLAYLAHAVKTGFADGGHIRHDEDLANLREDPRFEQIANMSDDRAVLNQFGAYDWAHLRDKSLRTLDKEPENGTAYHHLGWAYLRLGDHKNAIDAFRSQSEFGFAAANANYNVACCYAKMGETEKALAWLDKSVAAGFNQPGHIRHDPDLASLRGDSRFIALIESLEANHAHNDDHDHADHDHADHADDHDKHDKHEKYDQHDKKDKKDGDHDH